MKKMRYNFDEVIDRQPTSSLKWSYMGRLFGVEEALPMWVADMDFRSPQPVIDALRARVEHGIYGYPLRPPSYYQAIIGWLQRRHGWEIKREWLAYSPGVVPGLSLAINAYTHPGDKVIIQPPVYYPFFSVVKNNGRQLVENPLRLENNRYRFDLEGLQRLCDARTRLLILCSPHNPVGRVWDRNELTQLGELCLQHDIIVVSDEIHADLILKGYRHTPMAAISEVFAQNTVTLIAPSKTFNLAGLATAAAIIPNPRLHQLFTTALESFGAHSGNIFGIVALEAAYTCGDDWLDQCLEYIQGNLEYLTAYLAEKIPKIKIIPPEGTYLVWLDCRELGLDKVALNDLFLKKAKVALDDGPIFGSGGEGFQRINIACPRAILTEGLQRIERAVANL